MCHLMLLPKGKSGREQLGTGLARQTYHDYLPAEFEAVFIVTDSVPVAHFRGWAAKMQLPWDGLQLQ